MTKEWYKTHAREICSRYFKINCNICPLLEPCEKARSYTNISDFIFDLLEAIEIQSKHDVEIYSCNDCQYYHDDFFNCQGDTEPCLEFCLSHFEEVENEMQ